MKSKIGRISVLVIMGMLLGILFVPIVSAANWDTNGNDLTAVGRLGSKNSWDVTFITADTEVMRITTGNKVGIGTISPQEKLTLSSGSNFATEMAAPGKPIGTPRTSGGSMADGTYYYVITALDGVGETVQGIESDPVTINGGLGYGSVVLTWTAVTGAMSYKVYRTTTQGSYTSPAYIANPTWTVYTDIAASPSAGAPPSSTTAYIYKITASGNSWFSGGKIGIGTTNPGAKLDVHVGSGEGGAATLGASSCSATGDYAVAMGSSADAIGGCSVAMGYDTTASGGYSVAMGLDSTASGDASVAMGWDADATAFCSFAIGNDADATGQMSAAIGHWVTAGPADFTYVIGQGTDYNKLVNNIESSFMVGFDSTTPTLFVDGSSVGIGVTDPEEKLEIDGNILFNTGSNRNIFIQEPSSDMDGYDLTVGAGDATYNIGMTGYVGGDLYLRGGDGDGLTTAHGGDVYVYGGDIGSDGDDGDVILAYTGSAVRGNVGIGTDSPQGVLDVRGGNAYFNKDMENYDFNVRGDGDMHLFLVDASADNIGIGYTSPSQKLVVDGNVGIGYDDAGQTAKLAVNGKVGIGIANPSFELHVHDPTNQNSYLQFTHTGTGGTTQAYGFIIGLDNQKRALIINREEEDMLFYTDDTLRMGLKSNGGLKIGGFNWVTSSMTGDLAVQDDVGIGTDDPDGRLDVRGGNAYFNKDMENYNFNVRGDEDMHLFLVDASADNIGIGYTSPSQKLVVDGNAAIGYNDAGQTAKFAVNGDVGIGTIAPEATLAVIPTVTESSDYWGIESGMTYNGGTMTNWYGICVSEPTINSGSITNTYALVTHPGAGGVGIGTAGPEGQLDVRGGNSYFNWDNGDYDFNVRGQTDDNLFFVDASTNNVGIGTAEPKGKLSLGTFEYYSASDLILNTYYNMDSGSSIQFREDNLWEGFRIRHDTDKEGLYIEAIEDGNIEHPLIYAEDTYGRVAIGGDNIEPYPGASFDLLVYDDLFVNGNTVTNLLEATTLNADYGDIDTWVGSFVYGIAKAFRINHTLNESKYLVHGCLEGPEWGVIYRGNGTLVNGTATITLPNYYDSLTMNNSYTVQLTARGSTPFILSYDSFNETAFKVYGSVTTGMFDWQVQATRDDIDPLEVEPDKDPV